MLISMTLHDFSNCSPYVLILLFVFTYFLQKPELQPQRKKESRILKALQKPDGVTVHPPVSIDYSVSSCFLIVSVNHFQLNFELFCLLGICYCTLNVCCKHTRNINFYLRFESTTITSHHRPENNRNHHVIFNTHLTVKTDIIERIF